MQVAERQRIVRRLDAAMALANCPTAPQGERDAAFAAIGRLVANNREILVPKISPVATRTLVTHSYSDSEPGWRGTLHRVLDRGLLQRKLLSRWEWTFVTGLQSWRGSLTPKQQDVLDQIADRLGV